MTRTLTLNRRGRPEVARYWPPAGPDRRPLIVTVPPARETRRYRTWNLTPGEYIVSIAGRETRLVVEATR
jgi:hypothetical protein